MRVEGYRVIPNQSLRLLIHLNIFPDDATSAHVFVINGYSDPFKVELKILKKSPMNEYHKGSVNVPGNSKKAFNLKNVHVSLHSLVTINGEELHSEEIRHMKLRGIHEKKNKRKPKIEKTTTTNKKDSIYY